MMCQWYQVCLVVLWLDTLNLEEWGSLIPRYRGGGQAVPQLGSENVWQDRKRQSRWAAGVPAAPITLHLTTVYMQWLSVTQWPQNTPCKCGMLYSY